MGQYRDAAWYDAYYEEHTTPELRHVHDEVIRYIMEESANGRPIELIYDFGCGPGWFATRLNAAGYQGRYIGVDFSARAIAEALDLRLPDRFLFMIKDRALPPPAVPGFRAVALYLEVLEHVENDVSIIDAAHKPDDELIISVPTYDHEAHVRVFDPRDDVLARYRLDGVQYVKDRQIYAIGRRRSEPSAVASPIAQEYVQRYGTTFGRLGNQIVEVQRERGAVAAAGVASWKTSRGIIADTDLIPCDQTGNPITKRSLSMLRPLFAAAHFNELREAGATIIVQLYAHTHTTTEHAHGAVGCTLTPHIPYEEEQPPPFSFTFSPRALIENGFHPTVVWRELGVPIVQSRNALGEPACDKHDQQAWSTGPAVPCLFCIRAIEAGEGLPR